MRAAVLARPFPGGSPDTRSGDPVRRAVAGRGRGGRRRGPTRRRQRARCGSRRAPLAATAPPAGVDEDLLDFSLEIGGEGLVPGPEVEGAALLHVPDAAAAEGLAGIPRRLE